MSRFSFRLAFLFVILLFFSHTSFAGQQQKAEVVKKAGSLQMPFVANEGQAAEKIKFYARTFGGTVSVTKDGEIVYSLKAAEQSSRTAEQQNSRAAEQQRSRAAVQQHGRVTSLTETLVGAKPVGIKAEGKSATSVNYVKGNDKSKWKNNIPTYDFVNFGEVYEGIALKLKAYGNNVEKLFTVRPGADSGLIKMKIDGTKGIKVNAAGELEIETAQGNPVRFTKPVAYQETGGKRANVEVAYAVKGNEYSFKLGAYDKTKEIIIDPLLASVYISGTGNDAVNALASYTSGGSTYIYLAGRTSSSPTGFPVPEGTTWEVGSTDAFVARFNSDLSSFSKMTYIGGAGEDVANAMAVDASGNIYIAGRTSSSNFPTINGISDKCGADGMCNNYETNSAFVSKLDTNLTLVASTYLANASGDNGNDEANAIAIGNGNVYVAGSTKSSNFPIVGSTKQTSNKGGTDAFVAELNSNLNSVIASTYLGGGREDIARAIVVPGDGYVYIAGDTTSGDSVTPANDFPHTTADTCGSDGNCDDYAGTGPVSDGGNGCAIGATCYHTDAFVAKIKDDLSSINYAAAYLGDAGDDGAYAIAKSGSYLYVAGITGSDNFPLIQDGADCGGNMGAITYGCYQGSGDAFIAKLSADTLAISAAELLSGLGSNGTDWAHAIAVSGSNIYLAGETSSATNNSSAGFPAKGTGGAYNTAINGGTDAFVTIVDTSLTVTASTWFGGNNFDAAYAILLDTSVNPPYIYIAGETSSDYTTFPNSNPNYLTGKNGGATNSAFVTKFKDLTGVGIGIDTEAGGESISAVDIGVTKSARYFKIYSSAGTLVVDNIGTTDPDFFIESTTAVSNCNACNLSYPMTFIEGAVNGCCIVLKLTPTRAGQKLGVLKIKSNASQDNVGVTINFPYLEYTGASGYGVSTWTLAKSGNASGTGAISSDKLGETSNISCGTSCSGSTGKGKDGNTYVLTATAGAGSTASWDAAVCDGAGGVQGSGTLISTCSLKVDVNKTITAIYTLNQHTLSATKAGSGSSVGTVTADAPDSGSWADNAGIYNYGRSVTLTASATTATVKWTGCASTTADDTTSSTCTITMGDADKNVTATFTMIPINGSCASLQPSATAPSSGLCSAGTASTASLVNGQWSWSCSGLYGGTTASNCSALLLVNGSCGSANGQAIVSAPSSNLCNAGSQSSVSSESGSWKWTCAGSNNGSTANCSAPIQVNAACGSSNGQTLTAAPSEGLCSAGIASSVSGSGPWSWSCSGSNGGSPAACSASIQTYVLTVTKAGSGSGTVKAGDTALTLDYTGSYNYGTVVTLTAAASDASSTFTGWGGACSGADACIVTITSTKSVTATFAQAYAISGSVSGGSGGSITCDSPIMHGASTSCKIAVDTGFYISALTDNGATVSAADNVYTIGSVTAPHSVVVTFAKYIYKITVEQPAAGHGSVSCEADTVEYGGSVKCAAEAASSYHVGDITVDDDSAPAEYSSTDAVLTMDDVTSDHKVSAVFVSNSTYPNIVVSPKSADFKTVKVGSQSVAKSFTINNTGTADLNISSIATSGGDSSMFVVSAVTCSSLTPTLKKKTKCTFSVKFVPDSGGAKATTLIVNSNDIDSHTYPIALKGNGLKTYILQVAPAGNGSGKVTSKPAGINCGSACKKDFNGNTSVVLKAAASKYMVFSGWSGGGCSGTSTCSVTMTADTDVAASFSKTVTVSGKVLTDTGAAVKGVAVSLGDGKSTKKATSNSQGTYTFKNIAPGSYTISARTKNGYTFLSLSVTVTDSDLTDQNLTGSK